MIDRESKQYSKIKVASDIIFQINITLNGESCLRLTI